MNREEQLDVLIERSARREMPHARASDEVMVRLAAAETLAHLQGVVVPPALTERVEARLRARIHGQTLQTGKVFPLPHAPARRRRWLTLLSAAVLVLLLVSIGTLTAAARSLPGDALYGLKQVEDRSALVFTGSPRARAEAEIGQLRSALADLRTVVAAGRTQDALQQAVSAVVSKTNDSRAAVAAVSGADRVAAQHDLDTALSAEEQTLRSLLRQVNWPIRVALTQQLGALGDAIPTITQVSVSQQSDDTLLVTVRGTNFAPTAELVINGEPQGRGQQSTTTQLIVVISEASWQHEAQAIGVLNPDGTAAQTQGVFQGSDDKPNQQPGGDDHGGKSTPGPGTTPTAGDDNGGR
jgi:hypothetical protein